MPLKKALFFSAILVIAGSLTLLPRIAPAQSAPQTQAVFIPFPNSIAAEDLTAAQVGQNITIHGTVARVIGSTAPNVPTRWVLVDRQNAPVQIVFWPDFNDRVPGGNVNPAPGTPVAARGHLADFRGSLQLAIRDPRNLVVQESGAGAPAAPQSAIPPPVVGGAVIAPGADGYHDATLGEQLRPLLGQTIQVRGNITAFRPAWSPTAPNTVTIGEQASNLAVVFWTPQGQQAPDFSSNVGQPFFARGELQEHRGNLQLRVRSVDNLSLQPLAPPPAPRGPQMWPGASRTTTPGADTVSADSVTLIRNLGAANAGQNALVSGQVINVIERDGERIAMLRDATGQLMIILGTAEGRELVQPNAQLRATGEVVFNTARSAPELKATRFERATNP